jgi:hypothetical protein
MAIPSVPNVVAKYGGTAEQKRSSFGADKAGKRRGLAATPLWPLAAARYPHHDNTLI